LRAKKRFLHYAREKRPLPDGGGLFSFAPLTTRDANSLKRRAGAEDVGVTGGAEEAIEVSVVFDEFGGRAREKVDAEAASAEEGEQRCRIEAKFAQIAGRVFEANGYIGKFFERGGHSFRDHRFVTLHVDFDEGDAIDVVLADERIDGGDRDASDVARIPMVLLEFGCDDAVIGGVGVVVPELEHALGAADGEIVRLNAIEEALAAKNFAQERERYCVGFEGENFARRRKDVGENASGVADVCADVEDIAGAEEFWIAPGEGPEGIFVMALVKEGSGEEGALDGTEFEDAGFLDKIVGGEDGVGDEFIAHGSGSRTGMRGGAWKQCAMKAQ
jgi:hypothetical protein